jgi:hypothetical protein
VPWLPSDISTVIFKISGFASIYTLRLLSYFGNVFISGFFGGMDERLMIEEDLI